MKLAGLGRLTEEAFVCELGVGHLLLAGDLPIALELPEPRARCGRAHRGDEPLDGRPRAVLRRRAA